MSSIYNAPLRWRRVTRKAPCSRCEKPDWCARSDDERFEICRRHNDGTGKSHVDKSGTEYFVYYIGSPTSKLLGPKISKYRKPPEVRSEPEKAQPETLNEVYSFLLAQLPLLKIHRENLAGRGLSNEAILRGGYKSCPGWRLSHAIATVFLKFDRSLLQKVPGFCFKSGENYFAAAPGLLIPVRDTRALIVGLRGRLDDAALGSKYRWVSSKSHDDEGVGPGALIHCPLYAELPTERIRVTEGELKADIATTLSGILTVSLPGVSIWRNLLPVLQSLRAKTVVLAMDSDAKKNPFVARQLNVMALTLRKEGYAIEMETWGGSAKGIDDALCEKTTIEVHRGVDVTQVIEKIVHSSTEGKPDQGKMAFENAKNLIKDAAEKLDSDCGLIFSSDVLDALNLVLEKDGAEWARIAKHLKGKVSLPDLKKALRKQRQKAAESSFFSEDEQAPFNSVDRQLGSGSTYQIKNHCIFLNKKTENGIIPIKLSNFTAQIVAEEIIDDGVEQEKVFVIEGVLHNGVKLPQVRVPSEKFAFMNWVIERWGVRANVTAGYGKKDFLREAIQELSKEAEFKRTYGHLGWVCKDGSWLYLFSGGAISKDGPIENFNVDLHDSKLKDYQFPTLDSNEELAASIRASLSILGLTPPRIAYPVLAATYCAPLGEMHPIDFSLALYGITGRGKTQLAALAQAHFGAKFHGKHLPGNWSSTANALEKQSFLAKDAIFTVDDFAPQQTQGEAAKLNHSAERLFRSQGNRSGRGRLNSDMKARAEYFPRGLILSTGEDLPKTQSIRARLLIIEFDEGDVSFDELTPLQKAASDGVFAKAMGGYIGWLASRVPQLKAKLPERHHELRREFSSTKTHRRAPEIAASLLVAFETFLDFAVEQNAVEPDDARGYRGTMNQALASAIESQEPFQASEDPAIRFLSLIGGALISGRAYLADARTGGAPHDAGRFGWRINGCLLMGRDETPSDTYEPRGARIGWVGDAELLLDPDAAFAAAQNLAREQKNELSISEMTLWKQLAEKGFILRGERRNTIRRTVKGDRPYVLVFPNREVFTEKGSAVSTVSTFTDETGL